MFHRVKSEDTVQQNQAAPKEAGNQPSTPEIKLSATPANTSSSSPQAPAPTSAEAAKNEADNKIAASSSTPTFSTPNKDTKTMSEQSNTPNEQNTSEPAEFPANPYARAGMAPAARTPVGGYPGSYSAMNKPADATAISSDRRLTIGAGITLSGEIEACDYLLVEGTVEAALKGANVLDVAESGVFYGTVEINEATIAGRFEGDISVNGRLTITSTGTVTGTISYKELAIEAGAVIDGKITPLNGIESSKAKKPSAAKAKPAAAKEDKKADAQDAANNEGELFSKTAAAAE